MRAFASAEYKEEVAHKPVQEVISTGSLVLQPLLTRIVLFFWTLHLLSSVQVRQQPSASNVSVPGTQSSALKAGQVVLLSTVIDCPLTRSHVYFTHLSSAGCHVWLTGTVCVMLSSEITQSVLTHTPQH